MNGSRFLTAEWRYLGMLNYETDPAVVAPLVPPGCELDAFEGCVFISVVGFQFLRTRVLGIPFPFHLNFEEVNLRFYVRRRVEGEWRRGVVFVKELVPRRAIAWVARDGTTVEYRVDHPRWSVWRATTAALDCDVAALYGDRFRESLSAPPTTAFVADGSAVVVRRGRSLG